MKSGSKASELFTLDDYKGRGDPKKLFKQMLGNL